MEKLIRLAVIAWSEMRLVERFGPKMTAAAACAAFAFIATLAATGFAVAAMWISIDTNNGPIAASLWTALLFLILAAGLLIAMKVVLSSGSVPRASQPGLAPSALPFDDDIAASLHKIVGGSKMATLISAVIAGLMAGKRR